MTNDSNWMNYRSFDVGLATKEHRQDQIWRYTSHLNTHHKKHRKMNTRCPFTTGWKVCEDSAVDLGTYQTVKYGHLMPERLPYKRLYFWFSSKSLEYDWKCSDLIRSKSVDKLSISLSFYHSTKSGNILLTYLKALFVRHSSEYENVG